MAETWFAEAFALNATKSLHDLLLSPRLIGGGSGEYWTSGELRLTAHGENSGEHIGVQLSVNQNWLRKPPKARVRCWFLRREVDWHVLSKDEICYVLPNQWEREMGLAYQRNNSPEHVIWLAAAWCISAIDSLIVRHLIGHRLGLTEWPKQWKDWGHGFQGVRQFLERYEKPRQH